MKPIFNVDRDGVLDAHKYEYERNPYKPHVAMRTCGETFGLISFHGINSTFIRERVQTITKMAVCGPFEWGN
ncbi:MAG: hypothetical protein AAB354_13910 [candidate division KSB1 bacterium]